MKALFEWEKTALGSDRTGQEMANGKKSGEKKPTMPVTVVHTCAKKTEFEMSFPGPNKTGAFLPRKKEGQYVLTTL